MTGRTNIRSSLSSSTCPVELHACADAVNTSVPAIGPTSHEAMLSHVPRWHHLMMTVDYFSHFVGLALINVTSYTKKQAPGRPLMPARF